MRSLPIAPCARTPHSLPAPALLFTPSLPIALCTKKKIRKACGGGRQFIDVIAAMLDDHLAYKRILISFFVHVIQHGCQGVCHLNLSGMVVNHL